MRKHQGLKHLLSKALRRIREQQDYIDVLQRQKDTVENNCTYLDRKYTRLKSFLISEGYLFRDVIEYGENSMGAEE